MLQKFKSIEIATRKRWSSHSTTMFRSLVRATMCYQLPSSYEPKKRSATRWLRPFGYCHADNRIDYFTKR